MSASCVIFDCDGVLIDSEPIAARVAAECFRAEGADIDADEIIERFTGSSAGAVTETVFIERGMAVPEGATERRRDAIMAALEREVRPMPGVADVLASLSTPKCVASSSHPDRIALTLRVTGLSGFFDDAVFSAIAVPRGKPAPDLFLHAAERMGRPAADCVVIEDSVNGVAAGKAAGMRVVGFSGGGHCRPGHEQRLVEAGASLVIGRMSDLLAAL